MEHENPYASPSILSEAASDEPWPHQGVYRDGEYVVLHSDWNLPEHCLQSGVPASELVAVLLFCGNDDGSCFHREMRTGIGTGYLIEIPVSPSWKSVRWLRWNWVGACTLISIGLMPIVMVFMAFAMQSHLLSLKIFGVGSTVFATLCSIAFFVRSVMIHERNRNYLQLIKVQQGFLWLRGAGERYLERLPEWTGPKFQVSKFESYSEFGFCLTFSASRFPMQR